ncbi:OB-fold nucleic acid binding domain-containing protein [Marimonas arenosa]|uniref:Error-prone DNA polymerase n=1 Tax=Marimonas arenosa TaxID=1795305 RepID=A0AAE3WD66_9RHOB|nr:OB-fold nucleic acid binding domain-containing protein [Marimonas arenosa]MDQ2091081.1 OB-fold nucleic acid binding domain-containing protein [Marimonas arenosa]
MPDPSPSTQHSPLRPPACLPASHLSTRLNGQRITVAGIVILRQRPGTAKGVIFLTLEDETGIVNVIVWRALYERFRRAVIAGRCLRVTGRLQCENGVMHLIAERIEDISPLLDRLLALEQSGPDGRHDGTLSQNVQTG